MNNGNFLYVIFQTEESMQEAYVIIENDGEFYAEGHNKTCITFEVEDQDDADATEAALDQLLIEVGFDDGYFFESRISEDEE